MPEVKTLTIMNRVTYRFYAVPEVKTPIILSQLTYGLCVALEVKRLKLSYSHKQFIT